jgi:hypothetical protein
MVFDTVDDLVAVNVEAKGHRISPLLFPTFWTEYTSPNALTWQVVKFGTPAGNLPNDKIGVYCFVIEPKVAGIPCGGLIVYVGRARNSFRTRYREYVGEQKNATKRPKVVMMLNLWKDHLSYYYAELPNPAECSAEEERLLTALVPIFNSSFPAKVQAKVGAF